MFDQGSLRLSNPHDIETEMQWKDVETEIYPVGVSSCNLVYMRKTLDRDDQFQVWYVNIRFLVSAMNSLRAATQQKHVCDQVCFHHGSKPYSLRVEDRQ
jgi:hypothetical protein